MCSCSMVRSYSYLYYRNLLSEFIFFIALYSVSCVNIKRSDHSTTTCSHFYRVEPRYLELPAISNLNPFPLDFPLLLSVIHTRLSRTPPYLELFFVSLGPNQPCLSRTIIMKLIDKHQKVSKHSWKVY